MSETILKKGRVNCFYIEYHTLPDGTRHGHYREYYPTWQLYLWKNYVNGLEDGPAIIYSTDGTLMNKFAYKNGKFDGPFLYYPNPRGAPIVLYNYDEGRII